MSTWEYTASFFCALISYFVLIFLTFYTFYGVSLQVYGKSRTKVDLLKIIFIVLINLSMLIFFWNTSWPAAKSYFDFSYVDLFEYATDITLIISIISLILGIIIRIKKKLGH